MSNPIKIIAEKILGRPLSKKDGMSLSKIQTIVKSLDRKLPTALKDFYRHVGKMDMFMGSFEQFIKPYMKGEMLVFLQENQEVCHWGINIHDGDNPAVFQCADIESDNPEWYSEEVNLTDFLTVQMYYQYVQDDSGYGGMVDKNRFDNTEKYSLFLVDATTGYEKVVDHNGLVIYQNDGKMIWHFTDSDGNVAGFIFAVARTAEDMKELESHGFQRFE